MLENSKAIATSITGDTCLQMMPILGPGSYMYIHDPLLGHLDPQELQHLASTRNPKP